jgi:hypothetical protein
VIIVPFAGPYEATAAALDATGRPWQPADVSGDDCAYFRLLASLWNHGGTFTVVEHDITVTPDALDSLDTCQADWCSAPYPYLNGLYAGLGCARFRPAIMARHPDVLAAAAQLSDDSHPPMHWCRLDSWLTGALQVRGERKCTAHPHVGHPDRRPAHGCTPGWGHRS